MPTDDQNESDGTEGGGKSLLELLRSVGLIIVAGVLVFYGVKVAAWLLKTALLVGAAGAVGYVGYTFVRKKLGPGKKPEMKALPGPEVEPVAAPTPVAAVKAKPSPARKQHNAGQQDEALQELKEAMAELDALKRSRGE